LYEGFGLPALEALASGAPVVASNVTSLPEILGSSAVFVNPENVDSIAGGIEKLLTDDALSRKLVAKGREQAKKFSWETCAQEHVRVYERSIRGK
jgi:glycosyltransferase involved in cell wall biosynthesis